MIEHLRLKPGRRIQPEPRNMGVDDLRAELEGMFNPEPDEEGGSPIRDIPHPRLEKEYRLDLSYLKTQFENSIHAHMRRYPAGESRITPLLQNWDVPIRLLGAGLQLFGDSVLAYHGQTKRKGELRYYPPVILTFWSGFETFVRHASELFVTVKGVPPVVADFLRDELTFVEQKGRRTGEISKKPQYRSVLDRYYVLLRYAYGYQVDRGATPWQRLNGARKLRDYYTHLHVTAPRAISSGDVLEFMEAVLLGIILPSATTKRTQLVGIYDLYWAWDALRKLAEPFVEQPFFKDWPIDGSGSGIVYCPFEGVDAKRFPKISSGYRRRRSPARRRAPANGR